MKQACGYRETLRSLGYLDVKMLGFRGAVGSYHSLNRGVFPKSESMALIQAVKPYFYLQPVSFSDL